MMYLYFRQLLRIGSLTQKTTSPFYEVAKRFHEKTFVFSRQCVFVTIERDNVFCFVFSVKSSVQRPKGFDERKIRVAAHFWQLMPLLDRIWPRIQFDFHGVM